MSLFRTVTLSGLLICGSLIAQQTQQRPLNDQRIVDLVASGVSEAEIFRIIATAAKFDFDLRPVSEDAMMKAGVSEEVIKAMGARENSGRYAVPSTPQAARRRLVSDTVSTPLLEPGKLRVFVGESNDSWSFSGGQNAQKGSTHPQTIEVMKTFGQNCPNIVVTADPTKADFRVLLERESNKLVRKDNKFAAFNRNGDMVFSASTRNLGNSVRGFCAAIQ